MRTLRPTTVAAVGIVLLALSACAPSTPTPGPTSTPGASGTPAPSGTPETPIPEDVEVTAALVVVTSTTTSVFGTDGTTLASVNYSMDGAAAVDVIADALDTEPIVTPIPEGGEPCPAATSYDFGGLQFRSPGSLGSSGAFEVTVTAATTSGGIGIETVGGQRIGATVADFEAAVGETMTLSDDPIYLALGFDFVNPEAERRDRIGTLAAFPDGTLTYLATPLVVAFIGGCA
jgi:hypothetical protein